VVSSLGAELLGEREVAGVVGVGAVTQLPDARAAQRGGGAGARAPQARERRALASRGRDPFSRRAPADHGEGLGVDQLGRVGLREDHRWVAESPLPGGKLVIDHELTPAGTRTGTGDQALRRDRSVACVFHFYYGPRVAASLPASFDALAVETARRE